MLSCLISPPPHSRSSIRSRAPCRIVTIPAIRFSRSCCKTPTTHEHVASGSTPDAVGARPTTHADGIEIKAPDAWKSRSYAVRDKYDGLVFDRGLRGRNAASRVLGIGHTLFDIALDEARSLPVRVATLDSIPAPVLVVSVEDEVTGTGSLVHRLIFAVTDIDGRPAPLRDWELLRALNDVPFKGAARKLEQGTTAAECAAVVDRLRNAFEAGLSDHAPALRRPVCWPEMLFVPLNPHSARAGTARGGAPTAAG